MPSAFYKKIESQLGRIHQNLKTVFEWQGKEYPCAISNSQAGFELLEYGGTEDENTINIHTLKQHFPKEKPQNGDMISVESITYVIDKTPFFQPGNPVFTITAILPGADSDYS